VGQDGVGLGGTGPPEAKSEDADQCVAQSIHESHNGSN